MGSSAGGTVPDSGDGEYVIRWEADDALEAVRSTDGSPQFDSTAIDCPKPALEQDEWLVEFFASDPSWTLREDTPVLADANSIIELKRSG